VKDRIALTRTGALREVAKADLTAPIIKRSRGERATFITTALDNGASLEDVQSAARPADPSATKLYDRHGYNPEKSASFFANY